jgi:hypothetical protein
MIVMVWPTPQIATSAAPLMLRWRATMVLIATT